MDSTVDILILSNGPGELATWVKPVVRALRQQLGEDRNQVRISVVLSPCVNANGQEATIARSYPEVDRVQAVEHFFPFLLWGKTADDWDWRQQGVVLFLGGDQFYPVVVGKRLGYRTVVYAEWEARWHRWIDRFGVMRKDIVDRAPQKYADKFTVVGDLMAEAGKWEEREGMLDSPPSLPTPLSQPLIGILPGSKPIKLSLGVPLFLAIAERIHQARPDTCFFIAVAPALKLTELAKFADPEHNQVIPQLGWASAKLVTPNTTETGLSFLETSAGLKVFLWTQSPAYDVLSRCSFCITTVGANTAELGALAVPMLVVLPTQRMETIRTWDGLPGLLANTPILGSSVARMMVQLALKRRGQLAWPNIWAKEEIVPELAGELKPEQVADVALNWLTHPEQLQQIRDRLHHARGETGAAEKLVSLVREALELN